MIRSPEIAWLTGLLEGEGHFCMSCRSIAVVVSMTDHDVIERAAILLGGQTYRLPSPPADRPWKQQWRAQVKGPRAAGWMMTIYTMLGARRREQVRRTISNWRAMRYVRVSPLVEHSIVATWTAGGVSKAGLARRFGVSRETVYNVLQRAGLGDGFVREPGFASVSPIDIAWLAGLVEGEGNISINGRSLTIRIKMTDFDVVARAAGLLGGTLYAGKAPRSHWKRTWLTQIKGSSAAAWAMTLYPWLGIRRRQQARDAVAYWRRQGNGVVNRALADAIVAYRTNRLSQAEIMSLFKIGKSTVYRHTRGRLPRVRVTRDEVRQRLSALPEPPPPVVA